MKTTIKNLLIAIVMLTVTTSCDEAKEALDIKLNSNDKITLTVPLTGGVSVSESKTYDLSNNSDVSKYLDNLKGVSIKEVYYVISSFTGNTAEEITGSFSFDLGGQSFGPFEHDFKADVASAKKTTFDAAKLNAVASKLYADKKMTTAIEGSHSISETSTVSETVAIELHLKFEFTASPL